MLRFGVFLTAVGGAAGLIVLALFAPKEVVDDNGQTFYALNGMFPSLLAGGLIGGICFNPEFLPFFAILLTGGLIGGCSTSLLLEPGIEAVKKASYYLLHLGAVVAQALSAALDKTDFPAKVVATVKKIPVAVAVVVLLAVIIKNL